MTRELSTGNDNSLIPNMMPAVVEDKDFDDLASAGKFLPRLALCGSSSNVVKTGAVQMGTYALISGKSVTALGKEIDLLVIAWRATALDMQSEDTVIDSHDKDSELFKSIQHRADNESDSGCAYGPEFLVYIPSINRYATFLFGSKSARREAPAMKARMAQAATLCVELATNKRNSWHVPVVRVCSALDNIPPIEEIRSKVEQFLNPPVEEPKEKVLAAASSRPR